MTTVWKASLFIERALRLSDEASERLGELRVVPIGEQRPNRLCHLRQIRRMPEVKDDRTPRATNLRHTVDRVGVQHKGDAVVVVRRHLRHGAVRPVQELQDPAILAAPIGREVDDQTRKLKAQQRPVAVLSDDLARIHALRGDLHVVGQRRRGHGAHGRDQRQP